MSVRLEDLGVIGDMETVALVDCWAVVDWFCWPRIDSPSVFGALLDPDGGHWVVRPEHHDGGLRPAHGHQLYLSETNVLITRFHNDDGIVEVEDLMTVGDRRSLVRRVRCLRGTVAMRTDLVARPGYGRAEPTFLVDGGGAEITWDVDDALTDDGSDGAAGDDDRTRVGSLSLWTSLDRIDGPDDDGRISATFEVSEGDVVLLALGDELSDRESDQDSHHDSDEERIRAEVDAEVDETIRFWQSWNEHSTYRGRWRQAVERSALVLKLLTHRRTGGMVAAATTSIPEAIGGERNWDYRYVWIRDAAFTVYALLELGHQTEAEAFAGWLVARLDGCEDADPPLTPLYDLDGRSDIAETELDHWQGYESSTPVRVGNGASGQVQHDIFGELIDSLYLTDKHGDGLTLDTWEHVRTLVDHVIDTWHEPDQGMWEVRSDGERHTSSALMSWVAVERAIRMATQRGRPADLDRWRRARDEIHAAILEHGWNDDLGSFTRTFDGDDVDASILLAPLVKFLPGDDPRWTSTLDVVAERLAHGPLVDRYDTDVVDDGVGGAEGSFLICSFWYVEALARAGRLDEARGAFDRLLTYASPLGLFSEEIGPTGRQLGNFPQAFTHLALISAAIHLDEALDDRPD